MGTTREEATASIGIDHSTVARSLHALEGTVEGFGHRIVHSFKEFGAGILAGFGIEQIIEKMKQAAEQVEQMSNRARTLKISTSFLQDIENVGRASGKSQESIEKMLTFFARRRAPGSDLEKEFSGLIEKFAQMPDATERARLAFQEFGKSGADMLDIAGQGMEKFKENAKQFATYTEKDILAIRAAKEEWARFDTTIMTSTGKLLANLERLGRGLNFYFRGLAKTPAEAGKMVAAFEQYETRRAKELSERTAAGSALSSELSMRRELAAEELKNAQTVARVKLDAERELLRLHQSEMDKFKPTLDELARHGIFSGPARGIERLDRRIKRDFEMGNVGQAGVDIATRNRMFDSIAGRGVLGERDEPRRTREIQARLAERLMELAEGRTAMLVKAQMSSYGE